jgi:hypothetical protein
MSGSTALPRWTCRAGPSPFGVCWRVNIGAGETKRPDQEAP